MGSLYTYMVKFKPLQMPVLPGAADMWATFSRLSALRTVVLIRWARDWYWSKMKICGGQLSPLEIKTLQTRGQKLNKGRKRLSAHWRHRNELREWIVTLLSTEIELTLLLNIKTKNSNQNICFISLLVIANNFNPVARMQGRITNQAIFRTPTPPRFTVCLWIEFDLDLKS